MPSFGQPRQIEQLGKVDRWILNYLTLAAVLFASCPTIGAYIIKSDYYTYGAVAFLFAIALLKALAVPTVRSAYSARASVFLLLMLVLAMVNILISWGKLETSLRWVLWFGMVICLARISAASSGSWVAAVIRRLPFLFFIIYASILMTARYLNDPDVEDIAKHLSGLYGNLILASGLFANKLWQRIFWSVFGFIAIYFSGAGGALFTIPIMFVPYILYNATSMPVKGFMLGGLLFLGVLSFYESQLFTSFLNIKVGGSTASSSAGADRLERSGTVRLQLVEYGLLLVQEYPLGTGLGHTYNQNMKENAGVGSAHDGTLSMLIELGIPGFVAVYCLMAWMFLCIFRNHSFSTQVRAFYFTFLFTVFGRSLSENYSPLDTGNFFVFIFLIFSIYLFLNQKPQRSPGHWPPHPRGRMMMRPGLRPPMPRPVAMR